MLDQIRPIMEKELQAIRVGDEIRFVREIYTSDYQNEPVKYNVRYSVVCVESKLHMTAAIDVSDNLEVMQVHLQDVKNYMCSGCTFASSENCVKCNLYTVQLSGNDIVNTSARKMDSIGSLGFIVHSFMHEVEHNLPMFIAYCMADSIRGVHPAAAH